MNIRPTLLVLMITAYALIAGSVWAHHGTGISYDLAHPPVVLKGTVAEFRWANPHVILYIDVKDKNGQTVRWALEGNSIVNWTRRGYNRTTVKVGQEVTAVVYPSKVPNTPNGVVAHVTLPGGEEVLRFQSDTPGSRGVD